MDIGRRIKERRKALKMSADELGKRLGKDRSTIYRYEKGDIENLPLDILEPIAKVLDTTPAYLMGWTNKPTEIMVEIKEEPIKLDGFTEKKRAFAEEIMKMSEEDFARLVQIRKILETK